MKKYTTDGLIAACFILIGIASQASEHVSQIGFSSEFQSLAEAEAYYHARLVERPDLPLPRLELARIYILQGRDDLAREHFERVLASDPPQQVVININRFLDLIRARRKWSASVGFSIEPDDNIDGGSEKRIVKHDCSRLPPASLLHLVCKDGIAVGEVSKTADSSETSGIGIRVWGQGEYHHPLNDRMRLRFGGRINRTEYEGSKFDKMTLSAHTGPRFLLSPRSEISILATARRHYAAGNPEYLDLGIRLEAHLRLDKRTRLTLQGGRIERGYDDQHKYDGPLTNVAIGFSRVLIPTLRINGLIGWSRERPRRVASRNRGLQASAGISALLPKGFTIGGEASISTTKYEGTRYDVFDKSNREDKTRSVGASLHRRDFTVFGFSPEISVKREMHASNAQLADYHRLVGSLSFVKPF